MVAFLLMLCEGVHLAVLIEAAFSHGEPKLPVYLITSWGKFRIFTYLTERCKTKVAGVTTTAVNQFFSLPVLQTLTLI
jgi:hypothetical protein